MSISLLRRLLMKEAVKDTAGSSGILSINKNISDKVDQLVQKYVNDAMQQGVDLDTLSPEQLNMIVQMNKPKPARVIAADSPEGRGITEALLGKRGEVVDFPQKRSFKQEVEDMIKDGTITKGARDMKKSKKVQDREMFQAANKRLMLDVDSIIKDIKSMEPIDAMKEANSVIARKGKYKNLTQKDAKKILNDTEDHIFERDIPEDPEGFAKGGRIGLFAGAVASGENISPGTDKKGNVRDDNPFTGGGDGGNNNNNNPPSVSTNNLPPDTTFFDNTSKSGLISNISPSILARLTRMSKGLKPILGKDGKLGVEYLNEDELYDTLTNFKITQDLEDLIKTKKLEPELKYRKEIGENTFIEGGINQAGDANIMFKKQFADGGRIGFDDGDRVGQQKRSVAPEDFNEKLGIFQDGTVIPPSGNYANQSPKTLTIPEASPPIRKDITSLSPRFLGSIFDFKNIEDEENFAKGGIARAGFVGGGMGRRGFLKMLAGLGAGIGAAKTGILKFAGKEPVKQVTKEVVKQSASTPPPYFFKLAEKIKKLGDNTIPTNDRTIAKSLKSKDGKSNYILEEDVVSGDTIIKKVNKEGDEMITDVQIMELRKGEVVKGKDGRPVRTPDEYEEVTEANARIEGDVFNDPYYTDGIEIDEILKEVGEQAPSIKKASGGIARMLGE